MDNEPSSMQKYFAEMLGTFMLVWIGPGAGIVAGIVGVNGLSDVLAIAMAFGIAVALAIHIEIGRAHV